MERPSKPARNVLHSERGHVDLWGGIILSIVLTFGIWQATEGAKDVIDHYNDSKVQPPAPTSSENIQGFENFFNSPNQLTFPGE